MKNILIAFFTLLPAQAFAHVGHMGELAGHDHWVAGAAIGVAVGVAVWGWLKGTKADDQDGQQDADDAETQEA